jgi:hypothetical protein
MSWDNNDERNYTDYSFGNNKQYGETYAESRARERNNLIIQEREEANKVPPSNSGGYLGGEHFSTERPSAAKFLIKMGWCTMVAAAVFYFLRISLPDVWGISFDKAIALVGIALLVFGYFAAIIAVAFISAAVLVVYYAGSTSTGFEFGAVTTTVYLAALSLVAVGYAIGKFLGEKQI